MSRTIHDISLPLSARLPVWPGDPPPAIVRTADLAAGAACTLTEVHLSAHAGTHVDAPAHYLAAGTTVDALDLDVLIGPAEVVDLGDVAAVDAAVLAALDVPGHVARLLLRTRNSAAWSAGDPSFRADFVAVTADGARWLVQRGVRLVGIDGLSIAPLADIATPHIVLLSAGVVVIEGLDLSGVSPGTYDLVCLPLRLVGAEGAPARAVLIGPA
jgi:arylformamidase